MRLTVDTESRELEVVTDRSTEVIPLYSRRAFELLSEQWARVGWAERYPYTFSWMGRPVIQLPEDMIRIQEVIYAVQPDVLIETGVAHGGSLIFYASLFKAMGKGRVIGIDIEIRPQNRAAIEAHPLGSAITLIEGSSTADATLQQVRDSLRGDERVMVVLDSNHTKAHVSEELIRYAPLVTPGSYIVATDGVMQDLSDVPRGVDTWAWDNPAAAAREFAAANPQFRLEQPPWLFNESELSKNVTFWPDAWLRRVS
jgi:cephalosporin hydroxylase